MKKLFVILAVLTLFASMAMASETRLEGIGLNGGWWAPTSWMVSDANNVNLFPTTILKYPKLAVFEYDGDNLNSYVNIDLLGGVIGLYTSYDSWYNYNLSGSNSGVLYGRNLSDTMAIAVGLTYQQYLDKQVQNPTEVPVTHNKDISVISFHNTIGINLGLSLLGEIPMDFGLSLVLPLDIWNEETNFNSDGYKTDFTHYTDAGIQARLSGKASLGDMTVGLGVQFYSDKYEYINQEFTSGEALSYDWYDLSTTQYVALQLGTVKTVKLDKTTIFAGTQFEIEFTNRTNANGFDKVVQTKTDSTEYEDGLWVNVPLIIGAETKITDNWTVRAGAKKAMWNNDISKNYSKNADGKITSADDTYTYSDTNDLNVNFGATFEIAAFSIDFLVNKDLVLNGPEFVSGEGVANGNTTDWASKIALNFKW
ncbi:MAG: hypothetical protein WCJ46_03205 [bacterium]